MSMEAIKFTKNRKAAGLNIILAEATKINMNMARELLRKPLLVNRVWGTEEIPADWRNTNRLDRRIYGQVVKEKAT